MAIPQWERKAVLKLRHSSKDTFGLYFHAGMRTGNLQTHGSRDRLYFEDVLHIPHVANNTLKCQACISSTL